MINEDIKAKAKEAVENNTFSDIRRELKQMMKDQFPDSTPRDINNAVRMLRGQLAMPEGQEMQEGETQEELGKIRGFNSKLRSAFSYRGRPLNYKNLEGGDFDVEEVSLRSNAPDSIGEDLVRLGEYAKTTDDDTVMNNTNSLIQFHLKTQERKDAPAKTPTVIDVAWAADVGDLELGNLKSREGIYSYWKKISAKHADVVSAADEFRDMLTHIDTLLSDVPEELRFFEGFVNAANEFLTDYKKGVPNYILELDPFEMNVDTEFMNALKIMDAFYDALGVMPKGKQEGTGQQSNSASDSADEVSEGAAQTGQEALEGEFMEARTATETVYDASMDDMGSRGKTEPKPQSKGRPLSVDPIFWYKFNDDFSKIKIPKRQMGKIRQLINGMREQELQPQEEGGEVIVRPATIGLKYRYMGRFEGDSYVLDNATLDEFDAWFNKFEENLDNIDSKQIFHLPLSSFVEDYLAKNSKKKVDGITEDTVKFLDNVANIAESYKTSLSSYQKKRGEGTKETTGSAPWVQWAGETGKDRDIPAEVDKPWNDLLKAINEYYLIPLQGKNYVQAKEKPSWATGHSAMILSIKNAEDNAIGSLLDNMVSGSIHSVRPKTIRNITAFIKVARQTGARAFTKDIFSKGKKAVRALNSLFGKQYNSKNKEAVGYIIYDMARKLNVQNVDDLAKGYWSDIDSLYSRYKEADKDKYPITMLRYALNTPEFKAWLGLGEGKGTGEYRYVDPALATAVKELDSEFDTFHKMDNINISLLDAHDTIRKMKDRKVIYSHLSLDSIEHMDLVINKIHSEQQMDLTATEINKIVKAVASYGAISRNFGINEEVVYTVKAMFR